ncbi:hypothetical protein LJK87_45530 [Paenibacillus sp. P25]|nr:hypothetical protein LJK87_45530 [Paenibacillus sp. P25]
MSKVKFVGRIALIELKSAKIRFSGLNDDTIIQSKGVINKSDTTRFAA